jgi:hypothetical protein
MSGWTIRLRNLWRRSTAEKRLLLQALLLLIAVRLALWVRPFVKTRNLLDGDVSRPAAFTGGRVAHTSVMWAVHTAARYAPWADCLTQALVSRWLLIRHGYPAQIRIDVARDETGRLVAHTWVESDATAARVKGIFARESRARDCPRFPGRE